MGRCGCDPCRAARERDGVYRATAGDLFGTVVLVALFVLFFVFLPVLT